ncbi:MAG: 1-deoxy-D-xylulose-5-phosphate synthase [Candidatus Moranbacteria bacterium]|nr:1-deoxy-D-xylulose-5-phosphate synthase [Candidatus Moranbacteria bacterium]
MKLLDKIDYPQDLKPLTPKKLNILAKEIREFLLENVSQTGGHLASNLGVVELTLALHKFLDCPKDKLIWDVGHQSYVHKILTGRKNEFKNLRQKGGISGFPRMSESKFDAFGTGHSSTSISAAMGMAEAFKKQNFKTRVAAFIGDGSLTSGLALEAINQIGYLRSNVIIILNDNRMSINENVGALSRYTKRIEKTEIYKSVKSDISYLMASTFEKQKSLQRLRSLKKAFKKVGTPGLLFEKLGINYIGPIDGHTIEQIIKALNKADKLKGPVLIHARTKKGMGYKLAEKNADKFHGVSPFQISTGKCESKKSGEEKICYSQVFGKKLSELAQKDKKIIAVTAAMAEGTGLADFANRLKTQFYDVGICESHAVTFAGGLAARGYKPYVAIYSTFLQRSYDQIVHDICLQNLSVVFAIDRAGIVGHDGPTHHGVFDLSYLLHIPNMSVLAPSNQKELEEMLEFSVGYKAPLAIRYPKSQNKIDFKKYRLKLEPVLKAKNQSVEFQFAKSRVLYKGKEELILFVGSQLEKALEIIEQKIKDKELKNLPTVINVSCLKPIDEEIFNYAKEAKKLTVIEENVKIGGFGAYLMTELAKRKIIRPVKLVAIEDEFVEQGEAKELRKKYINN